MILSVKREKSSRQKGLCKGGRTVWISVKSIIVTPKYSVLINGILIGFSNKELGRIKCHCYGDLSLGRIENNPSECRPDLWLLSLFSQKVLCCGCQEQYFNIPTSRLQNGVHWGKGKPLRLNNLIFLNIASKQDKHRICLKKTHFPFLFAKKTYWPPTKPVQVSKVIWPLSTG